jgi:hypothetical protein
VVYWSIGQNERDFGGVDGKDTKEFASVMVKFEYDVQSWLAVNANSSTKLMAKFEFDVKNS